LPTFDKTDVWIYTCLPLLFRSLSFGDEKALDTIFSTCCDFKSTTIFVDSEKLEFFKDLFMIFSKSGFVDIAKLQILVKRIEFRTLILSASTAYTLLSDTQFEIEKIRWVLLAIGSCLRGFPHKLKSKYLSDFSIFMDILSGKLSSYSSLGEIVQGTIQQSDQFELVTLNEVEETSKLLQENWRKSANGIRLLICNCQVLITEIKKLA
jgi:hypothetical protein